MRTYRNLQFRLLPLFILTGILWGIPSGQVAAHATVISSSPAANGILELPPEEVIITFNEPIEQAFYSITVTGPDGRPADQDDATVHPDQPEQLVASLKSDLASGIYTIKWRAVSSDGHAISGTIPFGIGAEGSSFNMHSPAAKDISLPPGSLILIRWLFYIGISLCIGTVLFRLLLFPAKQLRMSETLQQRSLLLLYIGLAATVIGVLLSLPQQTANDAGVSWINAWDIDLLQETLRYTSFGQIWTWQAIQVLLLAIFIMGLSYTISEQRDSPAQPGGADKSTARLTGWEQMWGWLVLIACAGLMLAKAFIGHAAAADNKLLAGGADFIHLLASAVWLGGVLTMALLLPTVRKQTERLESYKPLYWQMIRRFSLMASICVIMLLLTGIYGGALHIPTMHALLYTGYGLVLLAKLSLMLIMLALALPAFMRGRKGNKPLGRGVWYEFGLGAIVLVLAAVLGNLPTAASAPGPANLQAITDGGYRISMSISPNSVGQNLFSLSVQDPSGASLDNIEQVTLSLTSREMDMGVIQIEMPGSAPLEAEEIITMGGKWNVHVHILLSTLDSIDHDLILQVGN
ncbi:copper resistance CopC/CopD family protein [Paenibacillus aceti]|uniref:Copper transport protein YcnJ n=1 Tax=Paenibacillus aceti TaxID=1820010 RepID=A0ABQ1VYX9_9BACL|nr:copper resistance CopC/CopD family protein [Paenibacillus aceti]GGG04534.1 copper transport protein YcnJ [Paenibacillus aceti]